MVILKFYMRVQKITMAAWFDQTHILGESAILTLSLMASVQSQGWGEGRGHEQYAPWACSVIYFLPF